MADRPKDGVSAELESLRRGRVARSKSCRDCGGIVEVYLGVQLRDARERTSLKSKAISLCAPCALIRYDKAMS